MKGIARGNSMYQHERCAFFVVDYGNGSFEVVELSSTRFATCNEPFKYFLIICINQSCVPHKTEKLRTSFPESNLLARDSAMSSDLCMYDADERLLGS